MCEDQRQSLQYQISMNSFKDETSHKLMLIQKMQYQLSSKSKVKSHRSNHATCEIVKVCRKNIQQIERIFVDIKSYFLDLKIQFIYELIANVFKVLLMSFKILSQKFIIILKEKKKQQSLGSEASFNKKTERLIQAFKNKSITQIEYLDLLIKNIEQDEKRLEKEKRIAEQDMIFERDEIQKINPSDAVNQLQTLKKQLDRIISLSEKLSGQGSAQRNQENYKVLCSFRTPQDIEEQYCSNISSNTKDIFVINMQKMAKKIYLEIREKQKQQILKRILSERPAMINKQTQTSELDIKNKTQNLKDKNVLIMQNQQLRKANSNYKKQLSEIKAQIIKMQEQRKQLERKNHLASETLNKTNLQLQKARIEYEYNLNKKEQTIEVLNRKITDFKSQRASSIIQSHIENPVYVQNENIQIPVFDENDMDDILSSKFKISGKQRAHHVSFYYEREFKMQRQQNNHLRKSLNIMLDALKQQKLILDYPISDLNNDLRLGKLINKIEAISIELLKKVKQIKLKDQPCEERRRSNYKKKTTIISNGNSLDHKYRKINTQRINAETQTMENFKLNNNNTSVSTNIQNLVKQQKQSSDTKTDDKLEVLKQELINRVNSARKGMTSPTNKSRLFLNEVQKYKIKNNNSLENIKPSSELENPVKIPNNKIIFNRKDISFEQFKINPPQENKPQYIQKKIFHKSKKSRQNSKLFLNQNSLLTLNTKRRVNNRSCQNQISLCQSQTQNLLQVHSLECDNQMSKIIEMIQSRSDGKGQKNNELKNFLNKFLFQIRRIKGIQFVQQMLKSQQKNLIAHGEENKIKTPLLFQF